jgi:energy-coupling factor transporter ATP-binding protein EcfA2
VNPILSVENLGYAYPSLKPDHPPEWVLREVNLAVQEGEFLSIMGPTGVGKTTLCLALNGIVPHLTGGVIRGRVLADGLDTRATPVAELSRRVGVVFQDPETQIFNPSVEAEVAFGLENLGIPRAEMRARIDHALTQVGMRAFAASSPAHLSGGQKQRVAIASILAMRPRVRVLDEPTANLAPAGKAEVLDAVAELRRSGGTTVVFVSHESDFIAELSDRVAVLNEGSVALQGSPAEVFAKTDELQAIGLQLPQVCETAWCLNDAEGTHFSFHRMDQAIQALRSALREEH